MIEVNKVDKKFTKMVSKKDVQEFYADKNISFNVNDGEVLGLLGPNGAGKTTLLRIIAGIMEPTKGYVKVNDLSYNEDASLIKKNIAFLSGNTKLYKDMSPYELLKMCGEYYDVEREVLEKRIEELSKKFGLEKFLYQRIESLSTGQLQRVSIARCAVHNPSYYIFDEATSGLDVISSKVILDFIKEEKEKGKCILYSTHYMEEAENICDRVVLIHKGNVMKIGTPKEIVKETKTTNLRDAFFKIVGSDINE